MGWVLEFNNGRGSSHAHKYQQKKSDLVIHTVVIQWKMMLYSIHTKLLNCSHVLSSEVGVEAKWQFIHLERVSKAF
jgi:hypothetical protein